MVRLEAVYLAAVGATAMAGLANDLLALFLPVLAPHEVVWSGMCLAWTTQLATGWGKYGAAVGGWVGGGQTELVAKDQN